MSTQPKKPAFRIYARPIRYRAGVPQITRRFLFNASIDAAPTDAEIRAKARAAVANDMPSTRVLFSGKDQALSATAVKAGTLNPIADIRDAAFIPQRFQFFFCEKRPAFL